MQCVYCGKAFEPDQNHAEHLCWDNLASANQAVVTWKMRVEELENAIRSVVTQKADDVCWMDAYTMLGKLVGIEVTPESLALLPTAKMLDNCGRFIDSLKRGCPYEKDAATERIKELERSLYSNPKEQPCTIHEEHN